MYLLINSGKINDEIDLNEVTWDYTIAKAMVNLAIKDVNKSWPTDRHFNRTCRQYEEIINGEKNE